MMETIRPGFCPPFTIFSLCYYHHLKNCKDYPLHTDAVKARLTSPNTRKFQSWLLSNTLGRAVVHSKFRFVSRDGDGHVWMAAGLHGCMAVACQQSKQAG